MTGTQIKKKSIPRNFLVPFSITTPSPREHCADFSYYTFILSLFDLCVSRIIPLPSLNIILMKFIHIIMCTCGFSSRFFKSLYWICYNIASVFYVLVFWPRDMWDLSSPTRDQTHTPCIGRQSLHHWTTREVPFHHIFNIVFQCVTIQQFMYLF